jgi:hypothetical protein
MNTVLRWARRHVAALLLIASPAIGGQLLPLAHPCPVEAPWVGDAGTVDPHAGHGHAPHDTTAPSTPSEQHAHADCTCIGACATPLALDTPRSPIAVMAAFFAPQTARPWVPVERIDGALRPLDRLPPQTAPPLA